MSLQRCVATLVNRIHRVGALHRPRVRARQPLDCGNFMAASRSGFAPFQGNRADDDIAICYLRWGRVGSPAMPSLKCHGIHHGKRRNEVDRLDRFWFTCSGILIRPRSAKVYFSTLANFRSNQTADMAAAPRGVVWPRCSARTSKSICGTMFCSSAVFDSKRANRTASSVSTR